MLKQLSIIYKNATKSEQKDVMFSFYAVWIASFLIFCPFPSDDLLRDVIIGNYGFDYRNLYIHSPLMVQYNQYILFDKLLYYINEYTGKMWTVRIAQLFAVINFTIPLQLIFLQIFKDRKDKYIWVLAAIGITLNTMVVHRLYLARPEVILAGWMLWGIAANTNIRKILWIILGIIAIPLYWLTIIYAPVTIIVFKTIKNKIIFLILLAILNVTFWQYYTNGQWIHTFTLLDQELANRLQSLAVSENNTILFAILSPSFSLLLLVLGHKLRPVIKDAIKTKSFNSEFLGFMGLLMWFLLANMIRYVDVVVPLTVIIAGKLFKEYSVDLSNKFIQIFVLMACSFSIFYANQSTIKPARFSEIPKGSKVLATFNGINYYVPFFNKETIQITPSMEIGSTEKDIQKIIELIQFQGKLDCKSLSKYDFDYLVERTMIEIPDCLKLISVDKEFRLWKIKK